MSEAAAAGTKGGARYWISAPGGGTDGVPHAAEDGNVPTDVTPIALHVPAMPVLVRLLPIVEGERVEGDMGGYDVEIEVPVGVSSWVWYTDCMLLLAPAPS